MDNSVRLKSLGRILNVFQDCVLTSLTDLQDRLLDQYLDIKYTYKNFKFMFYTESGTIKVKMGLSSESEWKTCYSLGDLDILSPHPDGRSRSVIKLIFESDTNKIRTSVTRDGEVEFN